ncbi:cytochrome P450 [Auricularia subglabra TFB-10046 SS5]|nr:cytochrome P450 [Auricularia subglabra TFB-10046 SS5]
MQFQLPGHNLIVINDSKIAFDLLEKRGSIYADRPTIHMAELMGWGWNLTFMPHSHAWRVRRRYLHQHLHAGANAKLAGLQTRSAYAFAQRLLDTPSDFIPHIRRAAASNIMRTAYGIEIVDNDPFVAIAEDAMATLSPEVVPGKWLVEFIPALKRIPAWFPGAKFQRVAHNARKYAEALVNVPFERVRSDMASRPQCMVSAALARPDSDETLVKETAAVMYLGGADTTVSVLMGFFLEMVFCPEVQLKAQDELDRVVGRDRLPTFADRARLPYVEAVIREVYRKYPVLPLGLPHMAEEDDVYDGMFISKGTILVSNIWGLLRNPAVYPDPEGFKPERYLRGGQIDACVPDPRLHIFGYGRRVCPGKHFADSSVFIVIATTLACFDIGKAVDENGSEITPSGEMDEGMVSTPEHFKCAIRPRSDKVQTLVAEALD